jgi:hypothetical protein
VTQEQDTTQEPRQAHQRPPGTSDATVDAVGTLSEAYEYVIRARGHLYTFHQLMGRADKLTQDAADQLARAGHEDHATRLREEIVGRNVLPGRWTFQVVEEFDGVYFQPVTDAERTVRDALMAGRRHVLESEMKDREITPGEPGHERR